MNKYKNVECVCIYKEKQVNNCNIKVNDDLVVFMTKDIELVVDKNTLKKMLED